MSTSNNNLADNFSYSYYTGTNKVKKVNSNKPADEYTYDANGNVTSDDVNRNGTYKYDWRNLLTDIRSIKTVSEVPRM